MMTADIGTNERDLHIVYGKNYMGEEVSPLALASVKYMYTDLTDIRKYYIRLGFHLDEFDRNNGYLDFGFATLEEFCEVNLGLDKSAVSRCINVFREFSACNDRVFIGNYESYGCAMNLSERWKNYSYTQLVEMLPLAPEDRERVLPDMSCKQIREFKKQLKQKKKAVASTQPKNFNYDEMLSKNGIVRQNYIKSRDRVGDHAFTILLYDSRGKEVIVNYTAEILDQSSYRLVLRMLDSFDSSLCISK